MPAPDFPLPDDRGPEPPTVMVHLLEHHFDLADAEDFLLRFQISEQARVGERGLTPDDIAELVAAWEAERWEDREGS